MKNSAETSTAPSRFKISEHQLSLGLLALWLVIGCAFGIWWLVFPWLNNGAGEEPGASRLEKTTMLFESQQWNNTIDSCHEMLVSDPENGYAKMLLAFAAERKWRDIWAETRKKDSPATDAGATGDLAGAKEASFLLAKQTFEELLENARYRNRAYEKLASLYSYRFSISENEEDADRAIGFLEEMLDNGIRTLRGIRRNRTLMFLSQHKQFDSVLAREDRLQSPNAFNYDHSRSQKPDNKKNEQRRLPRDSNPAKNDRGGR